MIPIPVQLSQPRFTLRTMLIGIAAIASMIALFSRIARPPEQAAFSLFLGIVLPSLWIGAWRQFTPERLLAQVMLVSAVDFMLVAGGRTIFLSSVALSLFIPSVSWYAISRMAAGAERDWFCQALRSYLIGLGLIASQVVASFIIVGVVIR
jgi:hypothetical protein